MSTELNASAQAAAMLRTLIASKACREQGRHTGGNLKLSLRHFQRGNAIPARPLFKPLYPIMLVPCSHCPSPSSVSATVCEQEIPSGSSSRSLSGLESVGWVSRYHQLLMTAIGTLFLPVISLLFSIFHIILCGVMQGITCSSPFAIRSICCDTLIVPALPAVL